MPRATRRTLHQHEREKSAHVRLAILRNEFNSATTACAVMVLQFAEVSNRPKLNLGHSSHLVGSWMSA